MKSINPTPYIFKDTFDFKFDTFKSKVDEYIDEASQYDEETPEKDGGISTVVISKKYPPHSWEEMQPFLEWMYPRVNEIWDTWDCKPMEKYLSDSWVNKHPKNAHTCPHHHQNVTIAVAGYLQVPKGSGDFMVKNPFELQKYSEPLIHDYYDMERDWKSIEVNTNDVLFFPGWLTHKTGVNKVDEDRYVVSLNIMGVLYQ